LKIEWTGVSLKAAADTALFRPNVHRVLRVTLSVHFSKCSFVGNHGKIAIYGNPADARGKFLPFSGSFRPGNLNVTVTGTSNVQFRGRRYASPEHSVEIVQ
jgi:hypothetical protein